MVSPQNNNYWLAPNTDTSKIFLVRFQSKVLYFSIEFNNEKFYDYELLAIWNKQFTFFLHIFIAYKVCVFVGGHPQVVFFLSWPPPVEHHEGRI